MRYFSGKRPRKSSLGACLFLLTSCSLPGAFEVDSKDSIDPEFSLTRQDYKDMAHAKSAADKEVARLRAQAAARIPAIPTSSPIISAPKPPELGKTKLVSISVTDDVPLRDVLLELSRLSNIDIEIGSDIDGGVNFRATNKPFNEVVSRIADLAGLRYSVKNDVLRIENDDPYAKTYGLDFLNMVRNSTSTVNVATDVLSGGEDGGGGSIATGSSSTIDSQSESDLWSSLEANVLMLLSDPRFLNPQSLTNFMLDQQQGAAGGAGGAGFGVGGGIGGGIGGAGAAGGAGGAGGAQAQPYVLNRQAGILSVLGTEKQHRAIDTYLNQLHRSASAQVLIEAKIVEVELTDAYRTGIDWTVASDSGGTTGNFNFSDPTNLDLFPPTSSFDGAFDIGILGYDLAGAVNLTKQFGTTRTLSSPRLHAINNQQAVLTFAENQNFFEITQEVTTTQGAVGAVPIIETETEVETITVPVGILLSIVPSINLERSEVTLNVRPTLSQVLREDNPGLTLAVDGAQINRPVVEVRELDSIMKLKSGQVMVIGGLLEDTSTNNEGGVPGIGDVPFLGNLFKNVTKENTKTELVIFIKATIVDTNGSFHSADRHLYEKFTDDPRPLEF